MLFVTFLSLFCILATLSGVYSWSNSNGNFNIQSIRQKLLQDQQNLVRNTILPAASILLGNAAIAQAAQGKLEYQPALQGLDYGKVIFNCCSFCFC